MLLHCFVMWASKNVIELLFFGFWWSVTYLSLMIQLQAAFFSFFLGGGGLHIQASIFYLLDGVEDLQRYGLKPN